MKEGLRPFIVTPNKTPGDAEELSLKRESLSFLDEEKKGEINQIKAVIERKVLKAKLLDSRSDYIDRAVENQSLMITLLQSLNVAERNEVWRWFKEELSKTEVSIRNETQSTQQRKAMEIDVIRRITGAFGKTPEKGLAEYREREPDFQNYRDMFENGIETVVRYIRTRREEFGHSSEHMRAGKRIDLYINNYLDKSRAIDLIEVMKDGDGKIEKVTLLQFKTGQNLKESEVREAFRKHTVTISEQIRALDGIDKKQKEDLERSQENTGKRLEETADMNLQEKVLTQFERVLEMPDKAKPLTPRNIARELNLEEGQETRAAILYITYSEKIMEILKNRTKSPGDDSWVKTNEDKIIKSLSDSTYLYFENPIYFIKRLVKIKNSSKKNLFNINKTIEEIKEGHEQEMSVFIGSAPKFESLFVTRDAKTNSSLSTRATYNTEKHRQNGGDLKPIIMTGGPPRTPRGY